MNKKPELYKCENNLKSHNKKYCYVNNKILSDDIKDNLIDEKIKFLINNPNYLNNIKVLIKTKNKEYKTSIVSKVNNKILTIDNEIIPVDEIISIDII
jgi:hypothetical protein